MYVIILCMCMYFNVCTYRMRWYIHRYKLLMQRGITVYRYIDFCLELLISLLALYTYFVDRGYPRRHNPLYVVRVWVLVWICILAIIFCNVLYSRVYILLLYTNAAIFDIIMYFDTASKAPKGNLLPLLLCLLHDGLNNRRMSIILLNWIY